MTVPIKRYLDWKVLRGNNVEKWGSLSLLPYYRQIIASQLKLWEETYLPAFSLSGKIVLDAGAGCGETTWFFFSHGASKVIAIEPNKRCSSIFAENAMKNSWNYELHETKFAPAHLLMKFDFAKVDCEGGELVLLQVDRLGACRVELHPDFIGTNRVNAIIAKHGLVHVKDLIWGNESSVQQEYGDHAHRGNQHNERQKGSVDQTFFRGHGLRME